MASLVASRLYAVLSWLIAALAVLHMATTWQLSTATAFTKVWFFGSGIAMAQAAALNLLNRKYGRNTSGLRWTTRAANIVILAFATVAGLVTRAGVPELIVMLGALGALLLLSCTAHGYREPTN